MCSAVLLRSVESTLLFDQMFTRPEREMAEQDEQFAENKATSLERLKGLLSSQEVHAPIYIEDMVTVM
jgi:hypothetical protein